MFAELPLVHSPASSSKGGTAVSSKNRKYENEEICAAYSLTQDPVISSPLRGRNPRSPTNV